MARGILNQAEVDALMELFGTAPKAEQPVKRGEGAAPEVSALRSALEATARQWAEALGALTGAPATVTLKSIVRRGRATEETGNVLLQYAEAPRYLVVPEPLVNLVNEKSLGALEIDPLLEHPLTTIDRELFASTGTLFSGGSRMVQAAQIPGGKHLLEARFDIAVGLLLQTTVRMVLHDESL
ncbi:hypothetical protein WCX18_05050 [Sulfurimonas sp. HSL1-2]|uniref:hypothetical protein n=1 Tax=Thiomicrolovo zhangzhouensis TaxID=3131933 RepID=UPI0031F8BE07